MAILQSILLGEAGFVHGFPERGVTDGELLEVFGQERVVQVKQVHGARVADAGEAPGVEADALVARSAAGSVAVGVRVADCVPVLVADTITGDVAAIHAGWRGVVAGVVGAAAKRLGGRNLIAAIGPCIEPCCFEVGADVAAAIAKAAPAAYGTHPARGGRAFIDLRAAVRGQLRDYVGNDSQIEDVGGCTKHEPSRFHSFRRDGANSGRMLAAIVTRPLRHRTAWRVED